MVRDVKSGALQRFSDFIAGVQTHRAELAATGLMPVHDEVWRCNQEGDPTPFKAFRYNEYQTTVARFGDLPGATAQDVLVQRIAITQEVRMAARMLHDSGALIFGLSDKPDEASLPNPAQAAVGMRPLHRLETLSVGAGALPTGASWRQV